YEYVVGVAPATVLRHFANGVSGKVLRTDALTHRNVKRADSLDGTRPQSVFKLGKVAWITNEDYTPSLKGARFNCRTQPRVNESPHAHHDDGDTHKLKHERCARIFVGKLQNKHR